MDALFKNDEMYFSYRISGILICKGKVLFQHFRNTTEYALPGGHAEVGETSEQTIMREFMEESKIAVKPVRMVAVGENFFPWPTKPVNCHQVSLYYMLEAKEEIETKDFDFMDELSGERYDLEFCWKTAEEIKGMTMYPANIKEDILRLLEEPDSEKVSHFVFYE